MPRPSESAARVGCSATSFLPYFPDEARAIGVTGLHCECDGAAGDGVLDLHPRRRNPRQKGFVQARRGLDGAVVRSASPAVVEIGLGGRDQLEEMLQVAPGLGPGSHGFVDLDPRRSRIVVGEMDHMEDAGAHVGGRVEIATLGRDAGCGRPETAQLGDVAEKRHRQQSIELAMRELASETRAFLLEDQRRFGAQPSPIFVAPFEEGCQPRAATHQRQRVDVAQLVSDGACSAEDGRRAFACRFAAQRGVSPFEGHGAGDSIAIATLERQQQAARLVVGASYRVDIAEHRSDGPADVDPFALRGFERFFAATKAEPLPCTSLAMSPPSVWASVEPAAGSAKPCS